MVSRNIYVDMVKEFDGKFTPWYNGDNFDAEFDDYGVESHVNGIDFVVNGNFLFFFCLT